MSNLIVWNILEIFKSFLAIASHRPFNFWHCSCIVLCSGVDYIIAVATFDSESLVWWKIWHPIYVTGSAVFQGPNVLFPTACQYRLLSRLASKKQPSLIVEQYPFYISLLQFVAVLFSDFMIRFNIMSNLRAVQCSGWGRGNRGHVMSPVIIGKQLIQLRLHWSRCVCV